MSPKAILEHQLGQIFPGLILPQTSVLSCSQYPPYVGQSVLIHNIRREKEKENHRREVLKLSLLILKLQEVAMLENDIVFNEAIIEEREQGIEEIQQQIGEVNEIFKDMAVLVHEQGVMIDDISSNIESSHAGTAQATCHFICKNIYVINREAFKPS
ncbi:Syntaxin-22 [Camellia lanceoleosa]|uniref:Syntaxin-22 n=1 Tax=Camellia lanceoleosa TaxID=1840588 RepID=A0ACC0HLZ6_9ERIC|nr:Syntaxin-22 [Camellia lanceoleosa]